MIAKVFHGAAQKSFSWVESPLDLMYGYRGDEYNVDLLSPYEMLLHWSVERILSPDAAKHGDTRSIWTDEGRAYAAQCRRSEIQPEYECGVHYIAEARSNRILIPDIPVLRGLRHKWCWEKRRRLHLPKWSYAKVSDVLVC